MDLDPPSSSPRKVRFPPKGPPPPRKAKAAASKETAVEDDEIDDEAKKSLARKVNEHLGRRKPKAEKKSSVQVAFTHAKSSTTLRTFGKQTEKGDDAAESKQSPGDNDEDLEMQVASVSTAASEGVVNLNAHTQKKNKKYKEPWDYDSDYPITLPLRRPYSGNPELLDESEFKGAEEYDENTLNSASDLGLLDKAVKPRMLFFKFPSNHLPLGNETAKVEEKSRVDKKETARPSTSKGSKSSINSKVCRLEDLPKGHMGKMLVYKSGAVKLKLGNILYDVSPGCHTAIPETVLAINTGNKQCCELGQVSKHAVVTPDIDFLLDNSVDLV